MARAFLFPGQGSQTVGMGRDLPGAFAAAKLVFQEVDDALSQHLSRLMFEGSESDLTLTENAQPALMAVSLAVLRSIEAESGRPAQTMATFVAGHSLGEYSALAAAGALSLTDAARLLKQRGRAMQQAVPLGDGAMAAVLGLGLDAVGAAVREGAAAASAETGTAQVCAIANDNGGDQLVISGSAAAVERAGAFARDKGAKRVLPLAVSAPFHCALMQPAADRMAEALAETDIQRPAPALIANVTAESETDPDRIRTLLVEQVTGMVRWRESVEALARMGVEQFVELGAGRVLSGLVKRIARDRETRSIGAPQEIEAFLELI